MCKRFSLLLFSAVCLTAAHADSESAYAYYVERTENGGVRFTDQPSTELAELQWVGAPTVFSSRQVEIRDGLAPEPFVEITSPVEDEAIRSNEGRVEVHVKLPPAEMGGVSCELMLNGQWFATNKSGKFLLEDLDRGRHRLKARWKDAQDKVLAVSQEVSFELLRYAIPRNQH